LKLCDIARDFIKFKVRRRWKEYSYVVEVLASIWTFMFNANCQLMVIIDYADRSAYLAGSCLKKELSILVLKLGMQFDQNFQKITLWRLFWFSIAIQRHAFILWLDESDSLSTCERGC
jgi:hypothetical protein